MIKALIFDFDGVIIDTETPDYLAWGELYSSYGFELPLPLWQTAIGTRDAFDPLAHLESLVKQPLDREELLKRKRDRLRSIVDVAPLLPGVSDYLAAAPSLGLKVGIASSATRWWIDSLLGPRGLAHHFQTISTVEDPKRAKPDPEVYQRAVAALNVQPSEALAIEDSAHGLAAATAAGVHCVVVPNSMTKSMDFSPASLVVGSLAERTLSDLLRDLEARRRSSRVD